MYCYQSSCIILQDFRHYFITLVSNVFYNQNTDTENKQEINPVPSSNKYFIQISISIQGEMHNSRLHGSILRTLHKFLGCTQDS